MLTNNCINMKRIHLKYNHPDIRKHCRKFLKVSHTLRKKYLVLNNRFTTV